MEQVTKEKDTTVDTLTSKTKVLAIGGRRRHKKREIKCDEKLNFKADCTNHLTVLLMGTRTPIEVADDWGKMDSFGMNVIEEDNQPKRYHFRCLRAGEYPSYGYLNYGQTVNAEAIMHEVRKRLKGENWISKYVLQSPLKVKLEAKHRYVEENYIRDIIGEALTKANQNGVLQYLNYLHNEYVKEKAAISSQNLSK